VHKFTKVVHRLRHHYGQPQAPPAKGPFELVMWENAVYLLPDERRMEVFSALRDTVGLTPEAIDAASDAVLLPIAIRGGMRPAMRLFRWRQIAQLTLSQFGGRLESILELPLSEARKALKLFPSIGDPGAERVLLLCGIACGLPLESNGLRVLSRLGWGMVQKNYSAAYRSVLEDIKPELPEHVEGLTEAHLLLRIHGRTLCKENVPRCQQCPLAPDCRFAQSNAPASVRPIP
jgi:endonuclease III